MADAFSKIIIKSGLMQIQWILGVRIKKRAQNCSFIPLYYWIGLNNEAKPLRICTINHCHLVMKVVARVEISTWFLHEAACPIMACITVRSCKEFMNSLNFSLKNLGLMRLSEWGPVWSSSEAMIFYPTFEWLDSTHASLSTNPRWIKNYELERSAEPRASGSHVSQRESFKPSRHLSM